MRKTLFIASCLATIAVAGCTGGSQFPEATGTATFRAINAIPTSPSIAYRIEELPLGNVDYAIASSPLDFDDLDYTFNFEVLLADDVTRTRVASSTVSTERDKLYTFLISGALAAPTITLWEADRREWAATDTVFEADFAHGAESLGPVDVYFQAPGIAPTLGQEVGTLSFTEVLPAIDYPAGDYVVIFTTAGDPDDILFTSNTRTPAERTSSTIMVFDATANDVGLIAARLIRDSGFTLILADQGSSPTVRFFHTTPNLDTSDVYTDDMLSDQIVADLVYRDVTGDLPIAPGDYTFTFTLADDVGSILYEGPAAIVDGAHNEFYVVGDVDELISFIRVPDRRSVETFVSFSFLHTDTNHEVVDFYIVEAGIDIADTVPRISNRTVGSLPVGLILDDRDFELYLTVADELTVLAGPIAFSPALGDVVNYISYDNVDPAISDLVSVPLP